MFCVIMFYINIVSGTSRHSVGRCAGACDTTTSVTVSAAGLAPPWAGTTGGRGQAPRARRGGGSGRRAAPRVLPRSRALPEGEGLPLGEGPGWAVSPRPGGSKPRVLALLPAGFTGGAFALWVRLRPHGPGQCVCGRHCGPAGQPRPPSFTSRGRVLRRRPDVPHAGGPWEPRRPCRGQRRRLRERSGPCPHLFAA